jgi:hypothetical protein
MSNPHFEVAGGTIDGVNVLFTTSLPYTPGTVAVFLNGQLLRTNEWMELGGRTFQLAQPPVPPDMVQVFYLDQSPVQPGVEVTPLQGVIKPISDIAGSLQELGQMSGTVASTPEPMLGSIVSQQTVLAQLDDVTPLRGTIEVC